MTEPVKHAGPDPRDEISLLALATIVVRERRLIFLLAFGAALVGLVSGLLQPRVYKSAAMFIPETAESGASSLALAASQFGIRVPTARNGWGPLLYVEVLTSHDIVAPIAMDTLEVPELDGRRYAIADLLEVDSAEPRVREERAIRSLRNVINVSDDPDVGTVEVAVATPWPSVSHAITERLIASVEAFNLDVRASRARAEREFVERAAAEAEQKLRAAEDALREFRQRNRIVVNSPELQLEMERLQREVGLRQTVLTSLLQSREESRINEVRDVPVITILSNPTLPVLPEARGALLRGIFFGFLGLGLGCVMAYVRNSVREARDESDPDLQRFVGVLNEARPRWMRR